MSLRDYSPINELIGKYADIYIIDNDLNHDKNRNLGNNYDSDGYNDDDDKLNEQYITSKCFMPNNEINTNEDNKKYLKVIKNISGCIVYSVRINIHIIRAIIFMNCMLDKDEINAKILIGCKSIVLKQNRQCNNICNYCIFNLSYYYYYCSDLALANIILSFDEDICGCCDKITQISYSTYELDLLNINNLVVYFDFGTHDAADGLFSELSQNGINLIIANQKLIYGVPNSVYTIKNRYGTTKYLTKFKDYKDFAYAKLLNKLYTYFNGKEIMIRNSKKMDKLDIKLKTSIMGYIKTYYNRPIDENPDFDKHINLSNFIIINNPIFSGLSNKKNNSINNKNIAKFIYLLLINNIPIELIYIIFKYL